MSVCERESVIHAPIASPLTQSESQVQGRSLSSSEKSQAVVILPESDDSESDSAHTAPSVQLGRIYADHKINFFNNNDDLFLGASAGAVGARMSQQQPTATALKKSHMGTGDKGKKEEKITDKFKKFKQKIVKQEEINQMWENRVEKEMEKIVTHLTPNTTYRVLTPPQTNRKGVECSNHFGGRARQKFGKMMKNVLNKINSQSRVQWLNKDEFEVVKGGGQREGGTDTHPAPPIWSQREADFPQLS